MTRAVTLAEFEDTIAPTEHAFRFNRTYAVHYPNTTAEDYPDFLGHLSYRRPGDAFTTTLPFVLSVKGCVSGDLGDVAELTVLLRLGRALERREHLLGTQVVDIALPRSFGFSGLTYGYHQTRTLFPHLL